MTTTTPPDAAPSLAGSPDPSECPKVRVSLEGVDGNALSLIGAWRRAARDQDWAEVEIDAVSNEALAGNYEHVIRTLLAHSEPPDDDDEE